MFYVYDLAFKLVARHVYAAGLNQFSSTVQGVTDIFNGYRSNVGRLKNWLYVVHEMWTSIIKNRIVGSSIS